MRSAPAFPSAASQNDQKAGIRSVTFGVGAAGAGAAGVVVAAGGAGEAPQATASSATATATGRLSFGKRIPPWRHFTRTPFGRFPRSRTFRRLPAPPSTSEAPSTAYLRLAGSSSAASSGFLQHPSGGIRMVNRSLRVLILLACLLP